MGKSKNLQANNSQNFILKGLNSIQVGLYFLLSVYILKSLLEAFLSDESFLAMMSIQIIENIGVSLVVFIFLFSSLAVFFSSRRRARKMVVKIWNSQSKKHFWTYSIFTITSIIILFFVKNLGYTAYIAPLFLLFSGGLLILLNTNKEKPYYLLAGINLLLAVLVLVIPSYWYSAILIVGISFLAYGVVVKK